MKRLELLVSAFFISLIPCNKSRVTLDNNFYSFDVCPKELVVPDDGDSFYCGEDYIRVVGLDTPETKHEDHGIYKNQEFGLEAKELTRMLLEDAREVTFYNCGKDKYDRTLAHVLVDGELLAVKLIKAGLGYETVSAYDDICGIPDFNDDITEAFDFMPTPSFQYPSSWRKENQVKR